MKPTPHIFSITEFIDHIFFFRLNIIVAYSADDVNLHLFIFLKMRGIGSVKMWEK